LLAERYQVVKQLLEDNRARLDLLAKTLLQEETITQAELVRILGSPHQHTQLETLAV
jgi:ATP-dependent Zn protease